MTPSLIAFCLWAVAANVAAMFPSKHKHWPAAVVLIATGIPLLGWITYENGPLWGLALLAAGASVLRWPVLFLGRWVLARVRKPQEPAK